jgi:hypothetical protein
MSFPQPLPVNPGLGAEYGPAVMPVHEWYPGVEVVQAMPGDMGAAGVNVVHEMGPGVRPVYFEGGLPSHLDPAAQIRQQAEQHQAYVAAQDRQAAQNANAAAQADRRRAKLLLTIL